MRERFVRSQRETRWQLVYQRPELLARIQYRKKRMEKSPSMGTFNTKHTEVDTEIIDSRSTIIRIKKKKNAD